MDDESNPQTSLSEGSPQGKLPEVDVPSSPATELNTMTQGDLDRLRETCSFPMGVQTRIPGKGKTVLSASTGEVAFYEVAFPAGLRFPVHPTIKRILNFYGICPAQLSLNAWRNIISVLVIWCFHRRHLSLNEFRCLYTLLKGPGLESMWLYFKARSGKNILKGAPSNVKGWKRRFFFVLGDDWEFHPIFPREEGEVQVLRSWGAPSKQYNKVLGLSPTEEERFCQVFEKIGGEHFKILVILTSRTFYKYFAIGQVEVSSSSGGAAKGDIRGEAEGDIREAAAPAGHASESSCSTGVFRLDVPSREGSIEFVKTIGDGMRIPLHASNLGLLRRSGERDRDHLGLAPSSLSSSSGSSSKSHNPFFEGCGLSEGSEMASKKRAPNDGSKGKEVAPPPEAKKIKTGSDAYAGSYETVGRSRRGQLGEANPWRGSGPSSFSDGQCRYGREDFGQGDTPCRQGEGGETNLRPGGDQVPPCFRSAQNKAIELEEALAEEKNKGKKAVEEIEARNVEEIEAEKRAAEDEGDGEGEFGQSLPSWISDHLGGKSYITDEANRSPLLLTKQTAHPKMDTSSLTKETNVMSQTDLDKLRKKYFFPFGVQLRIPGEGETILSAREGEVRPEKNLIRGSPSNVKGWKKRFFFASRDEWEFFPSMPAGVGIPRVPRSWGTPGKSYNALPALTKVEAKQTAEVLGKIEPGGYFDVSKVLGSRTFKKYFTVCCMEISTSGGDNITSGDEGAINAAVHSSAPGTSLLSASGTSLSTGDDIGSGVSMISSAHVARKVLGKAIPPADKEKVEQLSSEDLVTKSFHALGQNRALKAEGWLVKLSEQVMKFGADSAKSEVVARLEAEVAELTSKLDQAKELSIEEFKSSKDFKVAVTDSTATYFSEGLINYGIKMLLTNRRIQVCDIFNGDQDALSFSNEWTYLDIGDIYGDQGALSYSNEWAYLDVGEIYGDQGALSFSNEWAYPDIGDIPSSAKIINF
ncbi:hypothetical protein Acr_11g0009700 [Actinidia rufa]|uniref:Uncharacterized protein n=1 Tax=Actinidia rufa TaxID=165716 RepID=A0A7J0FD82_9ERIC|nr:hypothetical protein Acr_11g0009700 [Actinidia rufa]